MADETTKVGVHTENSADPPRPTETEDNLVDDKSPVAAEFKGATLQLDTTAHNGTEPEVKFAGMTRAGPQEGANAVDTGDFDRNRPGSVIGRKSVTSTGSKASLSSKIRENQYTSKLYFSKREGAFEAAVETVREEIVKNDLDGDIRGAWLLTEIDHWDNEREKMLVLCDWSLLVIKYDFITQKMKDFRRLLLHIIHQINIGDLQYPEKSLMKPRDHGGVRLHWGDEGQVSFGQKWNPFCSDIPYTTFTHHYLIYNEQERETVTFNVDDFYESLVSAVNTVYKAKNPGKAVKLVEAPILIESYANLGSMIFNQSHLGFNRDRGGVSF